MPNACWGQSSYSAQLKSTYQKPDFPWLIWHDTPNPHASVACGGKQTWCECIGESKPFLTSSLQETATRQVLVAGSAAVYHQIALGEPHPAVLLFTMVGKDVKFFQLTATCAPSVSPVSQNPNWRLLWSTIEDISLDITRAEDCFRIAAFSRTIQGYTGYREHFDHLWANATNQTLTKWWVESLIPNSRSFLSISTPPQTPHAHDVALTLPSLVPGPHASTPSSSSMKSSSNVPNQKRRRQSQVSVVLRSIRHKFKHVKVLFTSASKHSEDLQT